jgi:hypothetical protein
MPRVFWKKGAMKKSLVLIAMLLPVLAGCQSHSWLVYASPPVNGEKQGQECLLDLFGLGRKLDLTGNEAMRLGGIAIVRSVEYQVSSFHGWGRECVTARGE